MRFQPPGPNEALDEASALTGLLYPAFENATEQVAAMIIEKGLPPDPHGHSMLVRWFVKKHLEQAGHAVEDEQEQVGQAVEYQRQELNLLGLMVAFNGNCYRIRKADQHGFLPPPGPSRRMQRYYAQ